MPVIVVTRLRLRDPALLDEFFTDAVAAIEQAMKSEGNLGADALADANNAWWSVTAWQERRLMQAYVDSEPHLGISARLDHFCDEATFVDWEQASGRRNCGCHADPPRLHGPYWQWTRKVAAKTIGRWLSTDQHHDYQAWIDNDRRLHELLARLEALGAEALEADPRWER